MTDDNVFAFHQLSRDDDEPEDARPTIQVYDDEIASAIDETQNIILRQKYPIFQRAGMLVTPIWNEMPSARNRTVRVTTLRVMDVGMLRYMLNKNVARYLRFDGRQRRMVAIAPPDKLLQTMLSTKYWKLHRIAGLSNAPVIRSDGSLALDRGFDPDSNLWLDWQDDLVLGNIPEHPTMDEAREAKNLLLGLLRGFPFATEVDKSVALAALLTAVARGAFDIAPMFLFAAHTSGTGKSYLADVISFIINGVSCPVITMGTNREEMEKRLGALLLESPSIISLDNLERDLEGDMLCQMCSQRTVKTRVLGKSEAPNCEWRGLLIATGNNVRLVNDMVRRGMTCLMDAGVERPERRAFDFDPVEDVLRDRGKYLAAAMTIIRAYILDKNKIRVDPFQGYEGWSFMVREPICWLGLDDPVDSVEEARTSDPGRIAAWELIDELKRLFKDNPRKIFTASSIVTAANEIDSSTFGNEPRYINANLRELLAMNATNPRGQVDARAVGFWLARINGQVFGGYCIEIASKKDHKNGYRLVQKENM